MIQPANYVSMLAEEYGVTEKEARKRLITQIDKGEVVLDNKFGIVPKSELSAVLGQRTRFEKFLDKSENNKRRITCCTPHRGDIFSEKYGGVYIVVLFTTNHYVKYKKITPVDNKDHNCSRKDFFDLVTNEVKYGMSFVHNVEELLNNMNIM